MSESLAALSHVLVLTGDPVGRNLAGPAIRAWNLARVLSRTRSVRLISTSAVDRDGDGFEVHHVPFGDDRALRPHLAWADSVVFQGFGYGAFGDLRSGRLPVVADIYDPLHLELLEQSSDRRVSESIGVIDDVTSALNDQLRNADFFMCASETQRDFWLGALGSEGRLNPLTYSDDPDLRRLIDVVPFGIAEAPPTRTGPGLKGCVPGIDDDSRVLLWSGGVYDWFDPETLIRAVADVARSHSEVVLYFQGTRHPNPAVPEMAAVRRSRLLAQDLGVLGRNVIFNESWTEYDSRQNVLLDADAGVSTHFVHIETRFSFRTRILDYLWAELPMIVTRGDYFADLVEREGLGIVVAPGDQGALAEAIERVLFDEEFSSQARASIRRVRARFFWPTVAAPLVEWLDRGIRAGDLSIRNRRRGRSLRTDIRAFRHHLAVGGVRAVLRRVRARSRRR